MKKRALTLLLALAMIVSLAACGGGGGSSAAGSYKLTKMDAAGISMDLDEMASMAGVEMNITLELKEDGNFSLDMSALGQSESVSGTWKADGNNLVLSAEGDDLPVTFDGKTIVLEQDGQSLTFEKQ